MNRHVFVLLCVIAWPAAASGTVRTMNLTEALATALGRNPAIAAGMQDSTAARSRIKESRAALHPALSASGSYTRHQEPNLVMPIHQAGVFPPLDDQIYEGRLQLRAPIFDGGRRRAEVRAAEAASAAATARLDRGRSELIASVAGVYVQVQLLDGGLDLVAARREALRERWRELSLLLDEGRAASADLALVEASLAEALADSLHLVSQRKRAAWRLGQLLGAGVPVLPQAAVASPTRVPGAVDQPALGTMLPGPDPVAPALREATALAEQSAAGRAAAARRFWPELAVFVLLQSRSGHDLDFTTEWAAGIAVELPLFSGGKRRAGLQAATSAAAAAEHRLAAARQDQHTYEAIAREHWESARMREQSYVAAAAAMERAVVAQRELYREGRLTLADLLAQETEELRLRQAALEMVQVQRLVLLEMHATAGTLTADVASSIVEGTS